MIILYYGSKVETATYVFILNWVLYIPQTSYLVIEHDKIT